MSEPPTTEPAPVPVPVPVDAPAPVPPGVPEPPSALAGIWGELRGMVQGIDARAAVASIVAMAVMVVSHHQGDTSFFRSTFPGVGKGAVGEFYPYLYWHLSSFSLYLLVPLLAAALTPGERIRELGVGLGDWRFGLKATGLVVAVFVPVVFAASRFEAFSGHYPLCGAAKTSWGLFVAYELGFAAYFVAWEFVFRGYLLFAFERSMGKMAVFAQMMPFVIIHYGKPEAEVFGSIVAGIALGLLALRTRSAWYGAAIHIAAAFSMDVFASWNALLR